MRCDSTTCMMSIDDVLLGAAHGGLEGLFAEFRDGRGEAVRTSGGISAGARSFASNSLSRLGPASRRRGSRLGVHHQGQLPERLSRWR